MPISKTTKLILAGIVIFLLGMGMGYYLGKNNSGGQTAEEGKIISQSKTENKNETGDFVGQFKVTRVIDGDTI